MRYVAGSVLLNVDREALDEVPARPQIDAPRALRQRRAGADRARPLGAARLLRHAEELPVGAVPRDRHRGAGRRLRREDEVDVGALGAGADYARRAAAL